MAFFISRRLTKNSFTSCRSSSLCLLSPPSATISKLTSHFYLLHASSSTLKPEILEPSFTRSAPFATFRPSKPTFSPANDNRETRYSTQIPNSNHSSLLENEVRESARKSLDNIKGLKNALTVLGFVHIGIGAWIVGSLPFYPSILTQGFLASAVPLLLASKIKQFLQAMSYLNMKKEEGLFLISKLAWLAAWRLYVGAFSWLGVQAVVLFAMPFDVVMIPRIKISTITMLLFPAFCALQLQRIPSVFGKLVNRQLKGKVDDMIRSSNWMERRQVLKVVNIFLLRWKNASYLAAGLSCSWLLCVHLHGYGILKFYIFE